MTRERDEEQEAELDDDRTPRRRTRCDNQAAVPIDEMICLAGPDLRELRRQRVYTGYADAAADPHFVADMESVSAAFDNTVGEGLSRSDAQGQLDTEIN